MAKNNLIENLMLMYHLFGYYVLRRKDVCTFISPTVVNHCERYRFARNHLYGNSVLDIACGSGFGKGILPDNIKYLGVDLLSPHISYASKFYGDGFIRGSIYDMDNNDLFDTIISIQTFEHLPDIDLAFKILLKHLTPGGTIIFGVPLNQPDRYHQTIFTYSSVNEFLDQSLDGYVYSKEDWYQKKTDVVLINKTLSDSVAGTFLSVLKDIRPNPESVNSGKN